MNRIIPTICAAILGLAVMVIAIGMAVDHETLVAGRHMDDSVILEQITGLGHFYWLIPMAFITIANLMVGRMKFLDEYKPPSWKKLRGYYDQGIPKYAFVTIAITSIVLRIVYELEKRNVITWKLQLPMAVRWYLLAAAMFVVGHGIMAAMAPEHPNDEVNPADEKNRGLALIFLIMGYGFAFTTMLANLVLIIRYH